MKKNNKKQTKSKYSNKIEMLSGVFPWEKFENDFRIAIIKYSFDTVKFPNWKQQQENYKDALSIR